MMYWNHVKDRSIQSCDHIKKKIKTILASTCDEVMTLCFSLFGRTPQVSEAQQSRKARKMLPPEAGLLWLWGRLLRNVPIFITLHMILPQREESQCLIGEWKFQVYSTCCEYQAILPSY